MLMLLGIWTHVQHNSIDLFSLQWILFNVEHHKLHIIYNAFFLCLAEQAHCFSFTFVMIVGALQGSAVEAVLPETD